MKSQTLSSKLSKLHVKPKQNHIRVKNYPKPNPPVSKTPSETLSIAEGSIVGGRRGVHPKSGFVGANPCVRLGQTHRSAPTFFSVGANLVFSLPPSRSGKGARGLGIFVGATPLGLPGVVGAWQILFFVGARRAVSLPLPEPSSGLGQGGQRN